ncbi:hypothetical protein COO72_07865 [Bifidobacterium callitrichos]|nr:hypothetical protein COO72_07865 [Bifidobacterium callitrichos]
MEFKIVGQCRGNGKGYIRIHLSDDGPWRRLFACARTSSGTVVTCAVYDLPFPGEDPEAVSHAGAGSTAGGRDIVVTVPLLDECDLQVGIFDTVREGAKPLFSFPYKTLESKIRSRLAYKWDAENAHRIRDIDQRRLSGLPFVYVTGIYPTTNGNVVCRFHATLPWEENDEPEVFISDATGSPVEGRLILLESSYLSQRNDKRLSVRELDYSLTIPETIGTLNIAVFRKGHSAVDGNFTCLLPPMFSGFVAAAREQLRPISADPAYPQWLEKHRATAADVARQREHWHEWEHQPLISIVVVLFRTPESYLRAMLDSIFAQSYEKFELVLVNVSGECESVDAVLRDVRDDRVRILTAENVSISDNTNIGIRAAKGDYVAFVDHDDVIEPDTLYRYVETINTHPDVDLMYCDEDLLHDGTYEWPVFKPDFNIDLLYAHNYVTHMLMVSAHVLSQVTLSETDVAGAQDYDLTLKCAEKARTVKNVPFMLYHWRVHQNSTSTNPDSKPYADEAGRLALQRHFDRIGVDAEVTNADTPFFYKPRYRFVKPPKVSIVIPTKDHVDLLSTCLDSVFAKTTYENYDITLVENNSVEQRTFDYYEDVQKKHANVNVITWPGKGFNYSAICNYGVDHSDGELILFLNNDTKVITEGWLTSMVGFFTRPEVGVVGAKLLYSDGLIQHGGIYATIGGAYSLHVNIADDQEGYMSLLKYPSDVLAITGACQMIRRDLYKEIGGLDESFAVAFNDVDLCLKATENGYLTIFDPDSKLFHNEHSSRGNDERDIKQKQRFALEQLKFGMKWMSVLEDGRYMNPNLDEYNGHLPTTR